MDRAVVGFHFRQGAGGTTGWVCGEGLGVCCECRGVHQRPYGYSVRAWTGLGCEQLRSVRSAPCLTRGGAWDMRSGWVCVGVCLQP